MSEERAVDERGRCVIPQDIRESWDLYPGDKVCWERQEDGSWRVTQGARRERRRKRKPAKLPFEG